MVYTEYELLDLQLYNKICTVYRLYRWDKKKRSFRGELSEI